MRKFMVVMDDSSEFLNALYFAALRAEKTGGSVVILGLVGQEEFNHWLGVATTMREEAEDRLYAHYEVFKKWMTGKVNITPELIIRHGDRATQILEVLKEDPEIGVIVLGAGTNRKGPGPLVQELVMKKGGELPVPVTIVPGTMSREIIQSVT